MVNPVYQQDEELLLNPFGSKYLASGAYTDVNSNEFVVQEDTVISVLTGGDVSISENSIDYKTSMNLSGVTLKRGALIVAPVGEAFKSITIDSGSIMAYNCVVKGDKPSSFVSYNFEENLRFNGDDDSVSNISFTALGNNIGFSLWFKLDPINSAFGYFFNNSTKSEGLAISQGGVFGSLVYGDVYYFNGAVNDLFNIPNPTEWNHMAGNINRSTNNIEIFHNGVQVFNSSVTNNINNASILGRLSTDSNAYKGDMDDVLFYDGVITLTDAQNIYNGGAGADPLSVIPSAEYLYRFNNNTNNDGSAGGVATLNNFIPDPYVPHI